MPTRNGWRETMTGVMTLLMSTERALSFLRSQITEALRRPPFNVHGSFWAMSNKMDGVEINSPVYSADSVKFSLASLVGGAEEGLAGLSVDTLKQCLDPVMEGLRRIDAESLLNLQRVETGGAPLLAGVCVRPIHDNILPSCDGNTVRYLHLSEVPNQYSMGIFVFPPHSRIPMHDHPGMCVLSRILYGDLRRISVDLVREDKGDEFGPSKSWLPWASSWQKVAMSNKRKAPSSMPEGTRRGCVHDHDHLVAPSCTMLFPFEGNLHEFIAGPNGAAVLDVLLPPYDADHDRDCNFYEINEASGALYAPPTSSDGDGRRPCWIVPTPQPDDFHCISGSYGEIGCSD